MTPHPPPWLARYACGHHAWTTTSALTTPPPTTTTNPTTSTPPSTTTTYPLPHTPQPQTQSFTRRLGLVERSFDIDGTHFEGRADVHSLLTLEVETSCAEGIVKEKILRAWAALRGLHAFLRVRVVDVDDDAKGKGIGDGDGENGVEGKERMFVVDGMASVESVMEEAKRTIVFLEGQIDVGLFWRHCMNTARVINPSREMAKMFVLPLERHGKSHYILRTLLVVGHAVIDGLTSYTWHAHFTALLNESLASLSASLSAALDPVRVAASLPKAQEDLYPPRAGNVPRQRWAWAISRILRHVRSPPPAAFQNPLRRDVPLARAQPMLPIFSDVLDYSKTPPLNSFTVSTTLSPRATARLKRLCREAGVSVGAGGFALVGMSLMLLHERRYPNVPVEEHLPFVGHFPVNPRPFFGYKGPPDSMMLAFSDGLALPFLEASLPLEGRFRLLARLAHRQLGVFQKRPRSVKVMAEMGSRGPAELLPSNYLFMVERVSAKITDDVKLDPQGGYPARMPLTPGTCGVSSVGSTKGLVPEGRYAGLEDKEAGGSFAANWVGLRSAVRVRDNEFLVGSSGDDQGLNLGVSYDGNAMDEGRVEEWRRVILAMLEEDDGVVDRTKRMDDEGSMVRGKL